MLKVDDLKEKIIYKDSDIVPAFQRAGQKKIAHQISLCGDIVLLAHCMNCGTRHYAGSNNCRSRFCPVCAKKRSLLWLSKLIPIFIDWLKDGGLICKLNFTIKDMKILSEGIDTLNNAWRYMTHEKYRKEFAERFVGGIRALEVKIGENSKDWHPHYHSLVLKDKFTKDYDFLLNAWENSVNRVTGKTGKNGSIWLKGFSKSNDMQELVIAVIETFKYITKANYKDLENDSINSLVSALHKRKGINAWGILYDYSVEIEQDLQTLTDTQIKDKVCSLCGFNEFEFENIAKIVFLNDNTIKNLRSKNG